MKHLVRDLLFITGLGLTASGLYLVYGLGEALLKMGLLITALTFVSVLINKES